MDPAVCEEHSFGSREGLDMHDRRFPAHGDAPTTPSVMNLLPQPPRPGEGQRRGKHAEDRVMSQRSLVSVVDDNVSVRESLPDLLRQSGFDVEAFPSAEAFLESTSPGRTNCLILD